MPQYCRRISMISGISLSRPKGRPAGLIRHRHHLVAVSQLRAETRDGDIRRLFNTASALHGNFYENEMSAEDIAESLDDVQALLDRLGPVDI